MFMEQAGILAANLGQALIRRGSMFCVAESCTGGLCAAVCTERPGSSAWFAGGAVVYSNALKTRLLGVPEELLKVHGAVSPPVARSMVLGAAAACGVDCALAVSGIAGPSGGAPDKPVGTVCMALRLPVWAGKSRPPAEWAGWRLGREVSWEGGEDSGQVLFCLTRRFAGERRQVRESIVLFALELFLELAAGR
ncbi:MAG: CinA family protein [Desulfovibrionaceae bacterium]|nr:CinA family protein [Desulfovibrionaceae bacterium]